MDTSNDSTLDAAWYIDSETGDEVLIDRKGNKILARRVKGVIQEPKNA